MTGLLWAFTAVFLQTQTLWSNLGLLLHFWCQSFLLTSCSVVAHSVHLCFVYAETEIAKTPIVPEYSTFLLFHNCLETRKLETGSNNTYNLHSLFSFWKQSWHICRWIFLVCIAIEVLLWVFLCLFFFLLNKTSFAI